MEGSGRGSCPLLAETVLIGQSVLMGVRGHAELSHDDLKLALMEQAH